MEVKNHLTDKAQKDYILVQKALGGERTAYADLMKNYRDSLYFMLLKMTSNATDAEDLTIEAFGKAFKNLANYEPQYAFSTWLFKIATNNCIDFIRKKRMKTISMDQPVNSEWGNGEISQFIPGEMRDPEGELIRDQKIKLMRSVVDRLKPHYRELVIMRYFDELTYEEISLKLDLPLGTVKAKLFRARDLLYNILKSSREDI